MSTLLVQTGFEVRRVIRNRQFLIFTVAMPLIFYFLFLNISGGPNTQFGGTTWKTYFMISMASFSVMGSCIFGLSGRLSYERNQGWVRLVQTTPLSNAMYMAGKYLSQFAVSLISTAVLFLVGGIAEGVHLSLGQWVLAAVWLVVGSLPFVALGTLIGIAISVEATYLVANLLNFTLAILGGMWFPVSIMPTWMQHVSHWTPTYRFAHVGWMIVANQRPSWSDYGVLFGYLLVLSMVTWWILKRTEIKEL